MKKPISVYVKAAGATLLVLSSACLCGYRLMKIQIVDSKTYISQHYSTDTYTQTIAATRGEIVDCNGDPIVQNSVGYNIIIRSRKTTKAETKCFYSCSTCLQM